MKIRDFQSVHKLYDVLQSDLPSWTERCRIAIRLAHPGCAGAAERRRVVECALDTVDKYKAAQQTLKSQRSEPRRISPLEQIKVLTSVLNERGELSGGNFRRL